MNSNNDINKQIESYESLMHRVLQNYRVKEDYEDLLQEMRIVVWKALTNKNPKTMYTEKRNTKFTTYLYRAMANRLINIFIETSKRETDDKKEGKEESIEQRTKRNINKPKLFEDLSFEQQVDALQCCNDADAIRLKADIDAFYSILTDFEKKLWVLKLEGWTQEEIAKKLVESDININRSTVSRKLKIINNKFTKFIESGEL